MGELAFETVKTTPETRQSKQFRALEEAATASSEDLKRLTERALSPEDRKRVVEALAKSLGMLPDGLALHLTWSNGGAGTAMFRLTHNKDGEIAKFEMAFPGGSSDKRFEASFGTEFSLKREIPVSPGQLSDLILPPFVDREVNGVTDPHLKKLSEVFRELSVGDQPIGTVTALERTETAAFIARRLSRAGLPPTAENVHASFEQLARSRTELNGVPLFQGRAIMLAAHGQSILSRDDSKTDPLGAESAAEEAERGKDEHRFGREYLQRSLRLLAGETGSLELLRPEPVGVWTGDRLRQFMHINRMLFADLNRDIALLEKNPEVAKEVRAILAETLAVKDPEKLSWKMTPQPGDGPRDQAFFTISYDGKKIASAGMKFGKDGEMIAADAVSTAHDPAADVAELKAVREKVLKAITSTPAGPNGFTAIFDMHGASKLVALMEGIPVRTAEGNSIEATDYLAGDQIADAIIERSRKHPAPEGKPDIYVFAACVSGSLIQNIADRVQAAKVPLPLFMSQTEHNLLARGNGVLPVGNTFLESLLMPYEPDNPATGTEDAVGDVRRVGARKQPWNPEQVKKSPTVGDVLELYTANPLAELSNPMIIGPAPDDGRSWLQIR